MQGTKGGMGSVAGWLRGRGLGMAEVDIEV